MAETQKFAPLSSFLDPTNLTQPVSNIFAPVKTTTQAVPTTETPNITPLSVAKTTANAIKTAVTPRTEPVEVRRMFEAVPIQTKAAPIVTGLAEVGFRLAEVIPKVVSFTAANFSPAQQVPVTFDPRRLGFPEGTVIKSTAQRYIEDFANRQSKEDSPRKNFALSVLSVPVSDIFDTFVAGDIATQAAKLSLKATGFSQELEAAIQKLGLKKNNISIDTVKEQFMQRAQKLVQDGKLKELNDLGIATNIVMERLGGKGIPQLNSVGQFIEDTARTALGDVKDVGNPLQRGFATPAGETSKGALPGFRRKPGQAPAFGLSTEEVEPVGFGEPIASKKTKVAPELEPLATEARKYKTAEEFVKSQVNAYHGTNTDFDTFSKEFIGENQPADFGQGFYFAKDRASAASYAKEAGGDKVMEVNLDIKNPARNKDLLDPDIQNAIDDNMGFKDVAEILKEKGFDGIEYTRSDGTVEYTVFDPAKIKTKSQLTDFYNQVTQSQEKKLNPEDLKAQRDKKLEQALDEYNNLDNSPATDTPATNPADELEKILPLSVKEYEALPVKLQEKVFEHLPQSMREDILGHPEEFADFEDTLEPVMRAAYALATGQTKISADSLKQDAYNKRLGIKGEKAYLIETIGKGNYMKIFRNNPNLQHIDEYASNIQSNFEKGADDRTTFTGDDVLQALPEALELRKGILEKRAAERAKSFRFRRLKAARKIGDDEYKRMLKEARAEVKAEKENAIKKIVGETKERRDTVKAFQDALNLSDSDLNEVIKGRNLFKMSPKEFDDFTKELYGRGLALQERVKARLELQDTLRQKQFENVENLQKALRLPTFDNMTAEQLREFDELLQKFQFADVFISPRKLELIQKYLADGPKTYREARANLAAKLGVPVEKLARVSPSWVDRIKWDSLLTEASPFHKVLVEEFNAAMLEADATVLAVEEAFEPLLAKARKGTGVANKIIPTDEKIFEYMENPQRDIRPMGITPEQIKVGEYMRKYFADALAYEYEKNIISKSRYEDTYIPHIQRNFFEALKDGEIKNAFQELILQHEQDQGVINILDQKTGEILAMEKYFQFANRRSGIITPTKNVARAFMSYVKTFERKKALDKILPILMTYVDVLTPPKTTERGLTKDDRLSSFVKEWLNSKKGRKAKMMVAPGSKTDSVIQALKTFVAINDLGFNLALQIGSGGGVNAPLYVNMGAKRYATGISRLATARGRALADKYKNYTGKTAWDELADATKGLPEKAFGAMFGIFRSMAVRGNRIHLLGAITPQEWESGIISAQRLAEMRTELGRWLPVEGSKSIIQSTTEGSLFLQYKDWALPLVTTTVRDLGKLAGMLRGKNAEETFKSREFWELFRVAQVTAALGLAGYGVAKYLEKDTKKQNFAEKVINKGINDANSIIASLNPKLFLSMPRTASWIVDLSGALAQIVTLEKYKTSTKDHKKGDLKAPESLKKIFLPKSVRDTASALLPDIRAKKKIVLKKKKVNP